MNQWKDVLGYEGFYQVSSEGQIKRIKQSKGTQVGNVLKSIPNKAGYLRVNLCREGIQKIHSVHRLVAQAFVVNTDKEINVVVNHLNGVKNDNRLSNLEWVTHSENVKHSYRVLGQKASKTLAKLTETEVREIMHLLNTANMTQKVIGDKFGVGAATVSKIKTNRTWKNVV